MRDAQNERKSALFFLLSTCEENPAPIEDHRRRRAFLRGVAGVAAVAALPNLYVATIVVWLASRWLVMT
jgi:hypothetical protein